VPLHLLGTQMHAIAYKQLIVDVSFCWVVSNAESVGWSHSVVTTHKFVKASARNVSAALSRAHESSATSKTPLSGSQF
jgi:hypothetical protein